MTAKPPSVEYGLRQEWSTKEDIVRFNVARNQERVVRLVKGNLTTNGIQWSTWAETSATPSSKSTDYISGSTYTANWPGLEGFYVDELEAGLTIGMLSTGSTGGGTSVAYRWEAKNDDETTWTAISTFKVLKAATSTATQRTVSGYANLSTGYNRLPLELRLRFYAKSKMAKFRVKNSSYVAIKPKKQS